MKYNMGVVVGQCRLETLAARCYSLLMAQNSLSERMARTRRNQARALAGERGPLPTEAANDEAHRPDTGPHETPRGPDGLLLEFESLLPAIAGHYGYTAQDIEYLRTAITAVTPAGHAELAKCVRQWRIDAVVNDLQGLDKDVAMRAWIQFRQSVMGKGADENGTPYAPQALDCPLPPPLLTAPAHPGARH
jgi:hypothetical protein